MCIQHTCILQIISVSYDQVRKKEEEQQQRFLKENQGHLMAIYDKYFWEMKPSAKVTGKEQPVNTKSMYLEYNDINMFVFLLLREYCYSDPFIGGTL
jgi:hypothetical protein